MEDLPVRHCQPPSSSRWPPHRTANGGMVAAAALAVGIVVSCWQTLASGFRLVQGDLGDTRLVNFILEHTYRWLVGMPLADDLWSPPIFYPLRHAAFFTDLLLGAAPLYWPWRWIGCEPETAYQLWMITVWSLNFIAAYLLLRRGLRTGAAGAAAGAYLFSFASSMMVNIVHQQLVARFFLVAALAGIVAMFASPPAPRSRASTLWASSLLWLGLVGQLYTAVYPLVFFVLAAGAALIWALLAPSLRRPTLAGLRRHAATLAATGLVAVALSAPAAIGYANAAAYAGLRSADRISYPRGLSWFLTGRNNLLYGGLQSRLDLGFDIKASKNNGIGVVTLVAAGVGLWLGRRRPSVQLAVAGLAGLVLLTVVLPGGWSPWLVVRRLLPPAAAMRAVARVGLMVLFPAALGLAIVVDQLVGARRFLIVAALALAVVSEQAHRTPTYDKEVSRERIASLAARVPADAGSFLFFVKGRRWHVHLHDDAAWVALATGIPTVNGRSGTTPSGWAFGRPEINTPEDVQLFRARLRRWTRGTRLDPASVAWIRVNPEYHRRR